MEILYKSLDRHDKIKILRTRFDCFICGCHTRSTFMMNSGDLLYSIQRRIRIFKNSRIIYQESSTGMSYLQNQIQHQNYLMKVKTIFLCDVSIRHIGNVISCRNTDIVTSLIASPFSSLYYTKYTFNRLRHRPDKRFSQL